MEKEQRAAHERNMQLQQAVNTQNSQTNVQQSMHSTTTQAMQSQHLASSQAMSQSATYVQPVVYVAPFSVAWTSRLVEDFMQDPEACLWGTLAPCLLYAVIKRNVFNPAASGDNGTSLSISGVNPCDVLVYFGNVIFDYWCCICYGCRAPSLGNSRYGIRSKYNLVMAPCDDGQVHLFCHPCALCQESREVIARNRVLYPQVSTVVAAPTVVTQPPAAAVMVPAAPAPAPVMTVQI